MRDNPFVLALIGFPGLAFADEPERAMVHRHAAEDGLDHVALAYLRGSRSAGAPSGPYLAAVVEQVRSAERSRPALIKAELAGPIGQALQVVDEDERPVADDPALREALGQHTVLRARWLHDQLALSGATTLICLDEPFLAALNSPFCPLDWEEGADLLARTLSEVPGWRGLCVTEALPWASLLELPADVFFFNAYDYGAGLVSAAADVRRFLERGGALGWGIVPADALALAEGAALHGRLAQRLIAMMEDLAAASGLDGNAIARRSFVSAAGALTHLPAPQAAQAVTCCADVAAAIRTYFRLDYGPEPVGKADTLAGAGR